MKWISLYLNHLNELTNDLVLIKNETMESAIDQEKVKKHENIFHVANRNYALDFGYLIKLLEQRKLMSKDFQIRTGYDEEIEKGIDYINDRIKEILYL